MNRKITIQLFLVLFVASVLILPTVAGAATSSRTLPTSVNVGAPITVSIDVADYGSFGLVVETIPDGFMYIESSLDVTQAEDTGNTIRFSLMGETSFDYTLIAPDNENTYTFSGIIKDENQNEFTIGGDTSVILMKETVEQVNDPTPDEQTSTPDIQTTQIDSESVDPETIDEIPDESAENETSVDDVTIESSKSVKTTPSTESTEDIPATESTPFITTFEIIIIGIIATFVHKLKNN
ncbi:MAG: hypothetical protein P1P69_08080 [Methanosarcinaceae archaeon]|nr:hypothetical protein [Methanosarcinaceae archaeon]